MAIAYVKGEFVDATAARISIGERGFRFGDGVFETMRIREGVIRHLPRHLKRLEDGLKSLKIPLPEESLEEICSQLLTHNKPWDGILRLSVSRGIGSQGYLPTVSTGPTTVAETLPLPELSEEPLSLWLSEWRKPSAESLPVAAKLMQGVNSTLARLEAQEKQCDEALMLNSKGAICEASSANIFWRMGGLIYSPDASCGLVKGIARDILLEHWQVQTAAFDLNNLQKADSVMICNSIRGARPVFSLSPQNWQWMDDSLAMQAQEILDAA